MIKCEICNRDFTDWTSLGSHIGQSHRDVGLKGYYDKYIKSSGDELCMKCGNKTKFIGLTKGYHNHCSRKCSSLNKNYEKIKDTHQIKQICKFCGKEFKNKISLSAHINHPDSIHKEEVKIIKEKEKKIKIIKCEICNRGFKDFRTLGIHLNQTHGNYQRKFVKNYYDKYLKKHSKEGSCKTCGKPTTFVNLKSGYYTYCNTSCSKLDPEIEQKTQQTCLKKYGVSNYAKTDKWLNQMSDGGQAARMLSKIENPSKPQVEIFNIVKEMYFDTIINLPILNYCADIAIPSLKIIIEYNGEYWHRNKDKYDRKRKENIEKIGWKVLVYEGIKGLDIIPPLDQLKNDINRIVNENSK
jgi:hypothetical protein